MHFIRIRRQTGVDPYLDAAATQRARLADKLDINADIFVSSLSHFFLISWCPFVPSSTPPLAVRPHRGCCCGPWAPADRHDTDTLDSGAAIIPTWTSEHSHTDTISALDLQWVPLREGGTHSTDNQFRGIERCDY